MFSKPDSFGHDAEVWREQARGFEKAAEAAAAIGEDTVTAATEAVWKGPMPDERLARMEEQAGDATSSADLLAQMAQACRTIANEAESASSAVDDIRQDWDDGNIIDRIGMGGDADDVRDQFSQQTAGARSALTELATLLQPVIDRGDPLDYLFDPIIQPGAPHQGEQLDQNAANDYFETGVLADPQHVEEIGDTITGLSDGEDPPSNWNEWATSNGFTQAEVQAALDALDADERAALDEWLAENKGDIANDEPDPNPASLGLTSFLWQNMSPAQVAEFHNDVPNLEPTLYGDADGWIDGEVDMTVDRDITDGGSGIDVDQGSIGECATLASIAATVAADPTFIDRHIQENDNGTYTVTLYDQDGNPVDVTVNGYIPADDGNPIYNGRDSDGEINWASIYEKAMAQYQGGHYEEIDGAYTGDRITETVGEGNNRHDLPLPGFVGDAAFEHMRQEFEDGNPIVMGGGGHAYAVVGFDDDGNVLVQNPWGGDGSVVAMTPDEFNSGQFPEPADDWPDFSYVAVTE